MKIKNEVMRKRLTHVLLKGVKDLVKRAEITHLNHINKIEHILQDVSPVTL